jgi:hypothetical protein
MTANANNVTNRPACPKCDCCACIGVSSGLISLCGIPALLGASLAQLEGGLTLAGVITMPVLGGICVASLVTTVGTIIYYCKHAEPEEVGPR